MKIFDISPEITSQLAVFPGDQNFERKVSLSFEKKDHILVSTISSTCHLGSHADGPNHYHPQGLSIDKISLENYFGPCHVIEVLNHNCIMPNHLPENLRHPRVLFKTNSFIDYNTWKNDFTYIHPSTINKLAQLKIKLIGIDTPSVDESSAKKLLAHEEIFKNNMNIVEGLVLNKIKAGEYFFCGLPLKIKDADASPIRAILVKDFQ